MSNFPISGTVVSISKIGIGYLRQILNCAFMMGHAHRIGFSQTWDHSNNVYWLDAVGYYYAGADDFLFDVLIKQVQHCTYCFFETQNDAKEFSENMEQYYLLKVLKS